MRGPPVAGRLLAQPTPHSAPARQSHSSGSGQTTGVAPSSRGKTSLGVEEPALFNEPGVFIVSPDGSLYYGSTQTMPFARPSFADLLGAIDFAIAKDYPARGEFTGAV